MAKMEGSEEKALIKELSQGKELAKQLMSHLRSSSSPEERDFLVSQILSSYGKALSMLSHGSHITEPNRASESPLSSGNTRPRTIQRDAFKKRKAMTRRNDQVKVCLGAGIEGPLEDGYGWRKYGQKDILGSNYPRGYYRCTHRNSQGCLATKQVQRSDKDSSLVEITYRGCHTCRRSSPLHVSSDPPGLGDESPENPTRSKSTFVPGLGVKTEASDCIFPPFSFPPTPAGSEAEGGFFSALPDSTWHVIASGQNSESDLAEILSGATSATDSRIGDYLGFAINEIDFDSGFFDSPEFFT